MEIHALFDGLAWLTSAYLVVLLRKYFADAFPSSAGARTKGYLIALIVGAGVGAYGLGTANLWLAGVAGIARSIEGALAGAILGVELYKWRTGMAGRTAALFVLPIAMGIAVGRIGCYLAGLEDFTYGVPTTLPWGHDFGDGISRHPVQLYEAAALTLFAAAYSIALFRRDQWPLGNGFALFVLFYAAQRFGLEYLKPYPDLLWGMTIFQVVCVGMVLYALVLLRPERFFHAQRT
ncbi:prolipoprotein diacylglyceryl transferase [Devosia aquimaris]|uniref:prolipoprotein diacylglyceryl transferase n=1 Tax=Devosia aquimaris TaxID=2866214 RepID=UPI001CD0DC1A|nr:prolipoprotein diacylglyceryl transferase family protein [Devosia sp. CJK-A8-3]